jgi:hypothetical protein
VLLGRRLAGVDIFNRREVYAEYFPKLLREAAFEACAAGKSAGAPAEAEARYRRLELLDHFESEEFEEKPGVGVGTDRRFESAAVTGFELVYDGHIVHIAGFNKPGGKH